MHPFANHSLQTRQDLQVLVRDLVHPIMPGFSPGRAQVRLGEHRGLFGDPGGWLEGFARPLWGLVPLAAGGGGFPGIELWRQGLVSGTEPAHPEYWGVPGDYDQRSVEQAAFGLALLLAPDHLWKPLTDAERQRLSAWLRTINQVQLVNSNWLFFRVLVNLGLESCGEEFSARHVEEDLNQLERFHIGNGWFTDGAGGPPFRDGRTGDYYVPMGFQYYSLLCHRFLADAGRKDRIAERARQFAQDFQYYFSYDGAALPFGRSLTYKFAQGAFWGALAFAGVEALPWGVVKGLYLRHLRWWLRQPIFSEAGVLSIGYTYPNLIMAESYNSSQSSYWAMKTFLPLALPDTHPFWAAVEQPLPAREAIRTIAGARLILVSDLVAGDTVAINPGQEVLSWPRHAPQKYSKCAYSTRFAFAVPTSAPTPAEGGLDSALAVSDDSRSFRTREQCFQSCVLAGVAYSVWRPWPDVSIRTWLLAERTGHLRLHRIESSRALWSIDAGFAVPFFDRRERKFVTSDTGAEVLTSAGWSLIRDLSRARRGFGEDLGANGHLLASLAAMPYLRGEHPAGVIWLTCWCAGAGNPGARPDDGASYGVWIDGKEASVSCQGKPWWRTSEAETGWSSEHRLQRQKEPVQFDIS